MIDSHCHLDDEKFAHDLDSVVDRALAAGVSQMLSIGTGEIDCAVKLAHRYPSILATVGVHPQDAASVTPKTYDELRALVKDERVVAFGEIGLDYHYDPTPKEAQHEVFIEQLKIAKDAALPIVIHTRDAWEDTFAILREHWQGLGILHCFTGRVAQAEEALDAGLHLAFGGVLTFRNAQATREAARIVPDDRLLVETDAPYLAPVPWRGKRNEPAFLVESARSLAELRGVPPEHIDSVTTANFNRLCSRARYTRHSDGN